MGRRESAPAGAGDKASPVACHVPYLGREVVSRLREAGYSEGGSKGNRIREESVLPSMGSVADAYDNSMAESFARP